MNTNCAKREAPCRRPPEVHQGNDLNSLRKTTHRYGTGRTFPESFREKHGQERQRLCARACSLLQPVLNCGSHKQTRCQTRRAAVPHEVRSQEVNSTGGDRKA